MKKNKKRIVLVAFILVVSLLAGFYFYSNYQKVSTDNAVIDGKTVVLSPKIQGYIYKINVEDNQKVSAGEVIMEVDTVDYQVKVDHAKAALIAAQAALSGSQNNMAKTAITAPADVAASQKKVDAAQATWKKSFADKQRMQMLINSGACSEEQFDQAVATESSAKADLEQMKAELDASNAAPAIVAASQDNVEQLKAEVKKAEADLVQAENDLQSTKIIAPMDGRITKRSVEVGTYVQAGTQLCSLVGLDLWVTANFKENQMQGMRLGDKVDITVDAFPNLKLQGKVDSFQAGTGAHFSLFPAENATGNFVKTVQRIPVKITFDQLSTEDALLLGPGMSVVPNVYESGI